MTGTQIKFKKITFKNIFNNNQSLTIEPINTYILSDSILPPQSPAQSHHKQRFAPYMLSKPTNQIVKKLPDLIVVIYQFTYYNEKNEKSISTIPYYLSDGYTNGLRANMLFPFMCVHMNPDNIQNCPYSSSQTNGLLLKYKICKNLNFNKLNEWINKKFNEYIKDKNISIDLIDKFNKYNTQTVGLTSILLRMENLLDFIITISSDQIKDFEFNKTNGQYNLKTDIIRYRPYGEYKYKSNNPIIVDLKYKINFNNYEDISELEIFKQDYIKMCDVYRNFLLVVLSDYNKKISNIFKIDDSIILETDETSLNFNPLVKITREEFNERYPVCSSNNTKINENLENYFYISESLGLILKNYLIHQGETNDIFYKMISEKCDKKATPPTCILNRHLNKWDVKCKKKYLKYKMKYLALKKSINNNSLLYQNGCDKKN
jgi:hypothetical protein